MFANGLTWEDLQALAEEEVSCLPNPFRPWSVDQSLTLAVRAAGLDTHLAEQQLEMVQEWAGDVTSEDAQFLTVMQNLLLGNDPAANFPADEVGPEVLGRLLARISPERLTVHALQGIITARALESLGWEHLVLLRGDRRAVEPGVTEVLVRTLSTWTHSMERAREFSGDDGTILVVRADAADIALCYRTTAELPNYEEEFILCSRSGRLRTEALRAGEATPERVEALTFDTGEEMGDEDGDPQEADGADA